MSNVLQDAIMAKIAGNVSGDAVTMRRAVDQYLEGEKQELIERKSSTIEVIQAKLAKANESKDTPASVVAAYEKLLAQAVA
jgi:hypothetical protein